MREKYDKQGKPIDLLEWTRLIEDTEYCRVGRTKVRSCVVSTIWLGLDHQFDDGPPLIFETMIDTGDGWEDTRRYSTLEEAQKGHAVAVAEMKARLET
jgi:hypothetical protein